MISTKGRYALRVLIDIAEQDSEDFIPLKDIADRQELSKKYLEIIVKKLVKENMLTAASGRWGGYKLCKKPEEYNIGEVLELMEGSLATVACLVKGAPPCHRAAECKTLPLWTEFDKIVHDYFYGKTLADLLK